QVVAVVIAVFDQANQLGSPDALLRLEPHVVDECPILFDDERDGNIANPDRGQMAVRRAGRGSRERAETSSM
ncbi:MAG: hypothetical protein ABR517_09760, partial [Thermoanaerobaculia bacterium]